MNTMRAYYDRYLPWALGIAFLFGLLVFPFYQRESPYWVYVGANALFYAILASSWALLAGYNGQFSFAHMAFMGLATYASGIVGREAGIWALNWSPALSIPFGVLVAGVVGLLIGYLCLRLRSTYLALFTIAFAEILRLVFKAEVDLTGGPNGLYLKTFNLPFLEGLTRYASTYAPMYYTMLAVFLFSLVVMYALVNSRYGIFFRAVREDEEAAAALGVHVVRVRILAFVVSSMIAGLAGAVFHHSPGIGIVVPDEMQIGRMSLVIAMAVIGGSNNLMAAAIGALFLHFALEWLQEIPMPDALMSWLQAHQATLEAWGFGLGEAGLKTNAWRMVAFGILLMVTLRFWRNGLVSPILERIMQARAKEEVARGRAAKAGKDLADVDKLVVDESPNEGGQ